MYSSSFFFVGVSSFSRFLSLSIHFWSIPLLSQSHNLFWIVWQLFSSFHVSTRTKLNAVIFVCASIRFDFIVATGPRSKDIRYSFRETMFYVRFHFSFSFLFRRIYSIIIIIVVVIFFIITNISFRLVRLVVVMESSWELSVYISLEQISLLMYSHLAVFVRSHVCIFRQFVSRGI